MEIDVSGLTVRLGGRVILSNLSFTIPSGSSAAVVGVSGCGKTTLLRTIAGLHSEYSGCVLTAGLSSRTLYGTGRLTFLPQQPYLCRHLNVHDNLALALRIQNKNAHEATILQELHNVGLGAATTLFPHQLSVGMKARVAIARARCTSADLLLMDEPFAALDPLRRKQLNRQVQHMRRETGATILWVTHDVVEALQFGTHILPLPPVSGPAELINVTALPTISDSAQLSSEAIILRNQILRTIEGCDPASEDFQR